MEMNGQHHALVIVPQYSGGPINYWLSEYLGPNYPESFSAQKNTSTVLSGRVISFSSRSKSNFTSSMFVYPPEAMKSLVHFIMRYLIT